MVNENQNNVDFGYKSVKKSDKQKLVNNVFNSVARKYDLMNDITSLGIHRSWKSDLINWIAPQSNQNLADIAGGTGDIAYKFLNAGGNSAHIFDINKEMIEVSKQKYRNIHNLEWSIASAENIPALDNSFERATMSFGLRNITDRNKSLQEIYRILKPKLMVALSNVLSKAGMFSALAIDHCKLWIFLYFCLLTWIISLFISKI